MTAWLEIARATTLPSCVISASAAATVRPARTQRPTQTSFVPGSPARRYWTLSVVCGAGRPGGSAEWTAHPVVESSSDAR